MNDCEKCVYFGIPEDAYPETEFMCLWQPSEEDGYDLPCMFFDENVVDNSEDK